jgi:hypothetical protein
MLVMSDVVGTADRELAEHIAEQNQVERSQIADRADTPAQSRDAKLGAALSGALANNVERELNRTRIRVYPCGVHNRPASRMPVGRERVPRSSLPGRSRGRERGESPRTLGPR